MIKDKVYVGLIAGLVVPFVGYAILLIIFEALGDLSVEKAQRMDGIMMFSERFVQLLAIFLIIIPMQIFNKKKFQDAMRGLIFPLMGYCAYWIYTYSSTLL